MARRRITWRSRLLIRNKTPFIDNYGVKNNKRKREIEHDEKKPGRESALEEQVKKRKQRHDAFAKFKKQKPDPFGSGDTYHATKGDLLAISLAPLGAVVLAAAVAGGGELAAALRTVDEMCEVAGTNSIELSNVYKMD